MSRPRSAKRKATDSWDDKQWSKVTKWSQPPQVSIPNGSLSNSHFPEEVAHKARVKKRRSKTEQLGAHSDIKPQPNDVLCGRGGHSIRHVGNVRFRSVVEHNRELYEKCRSPIKKYVAQSIVEAIYLQQPPGRFLALDAVTGEWTIVDRKKAVDKTSQALRDGKPRALPNIEEPGSLVAVGSVLDSNSPIDGIEYAKTNYRELKPPHPPASNVTPVVSNKDLICVDGKLAVCGPSHALRGYEMVSLSSSEAEDYACITATNSWAEAESGSSESGSSIFPKEEDLFGDCFPEISMTQSNPYVSKATRNCMTSARDLKICSTPSEIESTDQRTVTSVISMDSDVDSIDTFSCGDDDFLDGLFDEEAFSNGAVPDAYESHCVS